MLEGASNLDHRLCWPIVSWWSTSIFRDVIQIMDVFKENQMFCPPNLLVGGLEHAWIMTFHSVGNVIIPTDELHHFSEGRSTTILISSQRARWRLWTAATSFAESFNNWVVGAGPGRVEAGRWIPDPETSGRKDRWNAVKLFEETIYAIYGFYSHMLHVCSMVLVYLPLLGYLWVIYHGAGYLWVILFGQMLVNLPAPWRILVRWSQEILAWYIASQSPAAWLPQRFAGLGIRERSQLWAAVYIYNYVYIYIYIYIVWLYYILHVIISSGSGIVIIIMIIVIRVFLCDLATQPTWGNFKPYLGPCKSQVPIQAPYKCFFWLVYIYIYDYVRQNGVTMFILTGTEDYFFSPIISLIK